MSSPTLQDVLTGILNTVLNVINAIIQVISQNASIIATVIVVGGLAYVVLRYGRRAISGVIDFLRGIF